MTTNTIKLNTKPLNWRAGRAPSVQVARVTIWGAGPELNGQRTLSVDVELARLDGDEHMLVVSPAIAADKARVKQYGGEAYRSVKTSGRPRMSDVNGLLLALAADAETAWASEGERMPGCRTPTPVKVTTITAG